jgi:DNA ligase-1
MAGQVDALVEGGIFPMLAQKFEKRKDKITYPAYCQPKFDGHRCIGIVKDGVGTLWSRTRKPIKSMPHIEKAIVALSRGHDAIFDGELYNHEYHDNFQQITKLITPKAPVEGHEKVMFYIYDMPSADTTFEFRTKVIDGLFGFLQDEEAKKALVKVATLQIDSEAEAILAFTKFLDEKYEGLMLRLHDNEYLSHPTSRSPGLIKMKHFDDAEFEIVDIREGRGKFEGLAIFVCAAGNGKTFDAVMNGSLEELRDFYQHREALIGRIVTVKFMGFTNDGVPRHGRALRFREDL